MGRKGSFITFIVCSVVFWSVCCESVKNENLDSDDSVNKRVLENANEYFRTPITEEEILGMGVDDLKTIIDEKEGKDDDKKEEERFLEFPNGDKCIGDIVDGNIHGTGTCWYVNGDIYEGEFLNGVRSGQGTMNYVEGDENNMEKYTGHWEDGAPSGEGTIFYYDGVTYDGELENDEPKGKGSIEYPNGDFFKGEFDGDVWKKGSGRVTYEDTSTYEGEIEDDESMGQGKMTYPNGDFFIGEFDGEVWKDGKGRYTYDSGNQYEGEFKFNLRHGEGIYKYAANSGVDQCHYVNDHPKGDCYIVMLTGSTFEGIYDKVGNYAKGVLNMKSGKLFEGSFDVTPDTNGVSMFRPLDGKACYSEGGECFEVENGVRKE